MIRYKNVCYIFGCGSLGAAIADELSGNGENVVIIDKDKDSFDKLPDSFAGKTLEADITDVNTLNENDIKDSKLIVITTDNENVNIFLAHMIASLYNPELVIVRLNTLDKKELFYGLKNVKPIFPFELSVQKFNDIVEELEDDEEEK